MNFPHFLKRLSNLSAASHMALQEGAVLHVETCRYIGNWLPIFITGPAMTAEFVFESLK